MEFMLVELNIKTIDLPDTSGEGFDLLPKVGDEILKAPTRSKIPMKMNFCRNP